MKSDNIWKKKALHQLLDKQQSWLAESNKYFVLMDASIHSL